MANDFDSPSTSVNTTTIDPYLITDATEASSKSKLYVKDYKYRLKRDKNNEASRRSRQLRKERKLMMETAKLQLEQQNIELKYELQRLELLASDVKAKLLHIMTS